MKRKKNASNGIIGGETVTTALGTLFLEVPHFLKYCLYDTTGKAFFGRPTTSDKEWGSSRFVDPHIR